MLSFQIGYVQNEEIGESHLLVLVEKTDTELVFEVQYRKQWPHVHVWKYFASPITPPRELLEYSTL